MTGGLPAPRDGWTGPDSGERKRAKLPQVQLEAMANSPPAAAQNLEFTLYYVFIRGIPENGDYLVGYDKIISVLILIFVDRCRTPRITLYA
jgi:hypothetical protein